jgi:PAS domain S-box-containing protein
MSIQKQDTNGNIPLSIREEKAYHLMIGEVEDYAILLLDKDGIIRNWNRGAEKIKGYKEQEIVGQHFRIFYRQEDRDAGLPDHLIDQANREGKAVHEGWRIRKDGSAFWGSIVITALHDESGQVVGFSKVTRDLTERKEAEDKLLRYAQQLEAQNKELQQFAYAAAHDMKEPLRKIRLYYSAIKGENGEVIDAEKQRLYLERSADAAARMQALIDDLLTYTKIVGADYNVEEVDLNVVIEEASTDLQELITQTGARIQCDTLPKVKGVTFQLRQLFFNLLSNALKYREETRPLLVSITSSAVYVPEMANVYGEAKFFKVEVRDNGIGFNSEQAERIFDMFERLHGRDKYSGTGIGLAICRRVMENNHGFIRARGVQGEGAVFELFFRR